MIALQRLSGSGLFLAWQVFCLLASILPVSAAGLPSGAGSLNERYQDWQVNCVAADAGARCAMSQIQADPKTRRRVLVLELRATGDGKLAGTLVMPFGLALDKGIALKVGDTQLGGPLSFSTCLPTGCLSPLAFDGAHAAKLKTGTALHVIATAIDSQQLLKFDVSLKGFSEALNRLKSLTK